MVIKLGDEETTYPIQIEGMQGGTAEVWLFDAKHPAEYIGTEQISGGDALTLPGQSISLYVFPAH